VDSRKTSDSFNPMDYEEVFSKRVLKVPIEMTLELERPFKASVAVVYPQ
jgi:hypothetical protein